MEVLSFMPFCQEQAFGKFTLSVKFLLDACVHVPLLGTRWYNKMKYKVNDDLRVERFAQDVHVQYQCSSGSKYIIFFFEFMLFV